VALEVDFGFGTLGIEKAVHVAAFFLTYYQQNLAEVIKLDKKNAVVSFESASG
jgi:hypothetical protein